MSAGTKHGERYTITLSEFEQRVVQEIATKKQTTPKKVIKEGVRLIALAHKTGEADDYLHGLQV